MLSVVVVQKMILLGLALDVRGQVPEIFMAMITLTTLNEVLFHDKLVNAFKQLDKVEGLCAEMAELTVV